MNRQNNNPQQQNQQNAQKKGPSLKIGRVHYIQGEAILEGEPVMKGMFSIVHTLQLYSLILSA